MLLAGSLLWKSVFSSSCPWRVVVILVPCALLEQVRAAIEQHLPLAGLVHVVRSPRDNQVRDQFFGSCVLSPCCGCGCIWTVCLLLVFSAQGGFTWTITFQTAVGDIPQITVVDELTGIGHKTWTNTTVNV